MSTVIEIETAFEKRSAREKKEFAESDEGRRAQVGPDSEVDRPRRSE